ncbi:MAG: hypothetical protein IAI50_10855, partial [Candidatus Eremiobacteraeota bacterium]|nr:hypothetical protein [Candidatus Eremiobacteraeota bacterium]
MRALAYGDGATISAAIVRELLPIAEASWNAEQSIVEIGAHELPLARATAQEMKLRPSASSP